MFNRAARMLFATVVLTAGCRGLAVKPMPERLSPSEQRAQDYGWEHFAPLGDLVDRTAMLDAILLNQAWHRGVDQLRLTSEKQVGDTRIVMESTFDRAKPESDSFTVKFVDADGIVWREEAFTDNDMDLAVALFMTPEQDMPNETPAEAEHRKALLIEKDARVARAKELFPMPPEIESPPSMLDSEVDADGE